MGCHEYILFHEIKFVIFYVIFIFWIDFESKAESQVDFESLAWHFPF